MYRILLADDEILVRDAIRENIDWKSMDCVLVADCENGKQAVSILQNEPVDIVLTDILMPYMDGLELAKYIQEYCPDTVTVIFSGFGEFEYAQKAMQYNVSEYLLKPVTSAELKEVIDRMKKLVDRRRQEKAEKELLDSAREKYRLNASVIRSRAMEALVSRSRDTLVSLEELKKLGILLKEGSFRVAVFDIDIYSELYEADSEKLQESALMAFILYNVADEIVTKEELGIVYQEGNSRVLVLFMAERSREKEEDILAVCREIQNNLLDTIGMQVSLSIGRWVRSPEELWQSRGDALELLKRRYLLGENLMLDMTRCRLNRETDLEEELKRLKETIRSGQKEELPAVFASIEENVRSTLSDKERAFVYLQQVIQQIGSIWESLGEGRGIVLEKNASVIREAAAEKSFHLAMERIMLYAEQICLRAAEINSTGAQRQVTMAVEYIRTHYMDPALSLNDLCAYLNISVSYFSSVYKEMLGETFTETLGRIRMDKARELLRNTTLRNYEIAERVGFSDPHYFGIAFKKATGMTPLEYAKEKRR